MLSPPVGGSCDSLTEGGSSGALPVLHDPERGGSSPRDPSSPAGKAAGNRPIGPFFHLETLSESCPASSFRKIERSDFAYGQGMALLPLPFLLRQDPRGGPHRQKSQEGDEGGGGEIEPDGMNAVAHGEPGGDVGSRRSPHDPGQVEGERGAGVAHGGREKFSQDGARRTVGHPDDGKTGQKEKENEAGIVGDHQGAEGQAEEKDQDGGDQHRLPGAPSIGILGRGGDQEGEAENARHLHQQEALAGVAEPGRAPPQGKDRHQVEEDEGREKGKDPDEKGHGMSSEDGEDGKRHPLPLLQGFAEGGGFEDPKPDPESDHHEKGAQEKGKAPSPGREFGLRREVGEKEKDAGREDEAGGGSQLGKHPIPGSLPAGGVFGGQEDRPAPFPAQPDPLPQTAEGEKQGGNQPHLSVGGKHPDQDGRDPHREKGGDQGGLPSHPVPEMAEEDRSHGPGQKGQCEGGQGLQGGGGGVSRGKEEGRKDQDRGGGKDVEVEELDSGSDDAGQKDLAAGGGWVHGRSDSG